MASTVLMQGLLGVYAVIMVASLYEGNWPRALYWLGALLITMAVLWGTR